MEQLKLARAELHVAKLVHKVYTIENKINGLHTVYTRYTVRYTKTIDK